MPPFSRKTIFMRDQLLRKNCVYRFRLNVTADCQFENSVERFESMKFVFAIGAGM
jgi:hypothetical protein